MNITLLLGDAGVPSYKIMRSVSRANPEIQYTVALRDKASGTGETLGYNPNVLAYLSKTSSTLRYPQMYALGSRSYRNGLKRVIDWDTDLIHTFQYPDDLGVVAKKFSNLPVIHHVLDLKSLYDKRIYAMPESKSFFKMHRLARPFVLKKELAWERFVHENCDALVYTSEEMLEVAKQKYGNFRSVVIPNAVLKDDLPQKHLPKLSEFDSEIHVVYIGAIQLKKGHRKILPTLQRIADSGINVHLYPIIYNQATSEFVLKICHANPKMHYHSPLHYRWLLKELTQYDYGLVLLSKANEKLLNVAIPNKLYDYLSVGLPVVVSPYRSLIDFVKQKGCGSVLYQDKEIDHVFNRQIRVAFREEYTIDYHIGKLIRLYEELCREKD